MKLIIPSCRRAGTLTTPTLMPFCSGAVEVHLVVHSDQEKEQYLAAGRTGRAQVHVSGVGLGIGKHRNWILENLVEDGEWVMMADDNIRRLTALERPYYNEAIVPKTPEVKRAFRRELSAARFPSVIREAVQCAEATGAKLVGFSTTDNYYFRTKKWRSVGFVVTKLCLVKKTALRFDPAARAMDDYEFTAKNLLEYGCVCINNYVKPEAKHYEPGGIGEYGERVTYKVMDATRIMARYPGLFTYAKKPGCHPTSELRMRFTNTKQVARWQEEMLAAAEPAPGV